MRVLDLGSGTGMWAQAFTAWYDSIDVIAVEPSEAMRARSVHQPARKLRAGRFQVRHSAQRVGRLPRPANPVR